VSGRGRPVVLSAVLGVLLALAVAVQLLRDRAYPQTPMENRVLYVSSGKVIEKVGLSYDTLLADVYWVRALQHYGGERLKADGDKTYDRLYPLLDLTTTLDPRFTIAYRFGAIFLAEPRPGGAGRPDLAIALLKKGIAATPGKWDYYHDVGFVYYWNLRDYQRAAEWFRRGGDLPGAPWWLKTYAAIMLARGGDRQASRMMWQQVGQTAENEWLRQTAQLRLMQLDALDQIDVLRRLAGEFRNRTGKPPESWEQLIRAGLLASTPVDPSGEPYTLNFATGEVDISGRSRLYPLPTEPAAAPELDAPAGKPM
jgi:tetratricopeptide (TPR) repeat protein